MKRIYLIPKLQKISIEQWKWDNSWHGYAFYNWLWFYNIRRKFIHFKVNKTIITFYKTIPKEVEITYSYVNFNEV